MEKNLIGIEKSTTEVFVYFSISPIDRRFEDSLYQHLLSCLGTLDDPTQDIRVINDIFVHIGDINVIRYQFGSTDSADSDIDYVSGRIEQEFCNWVVRMGGYEFVRP